MKKPLEVGQFWHDQVNRDLLRIEKIVKEALDDGRLVEYVQCSCFVRGYYFGVQEMQSSHFEEDRQYEPNQNMPRFKQLSWLGGYWVLWSARWRALWNS